jgi:hypothetical protein
LPAHPHSHGTHLRVQFRKITILMITFSPARKNVTKTLNSWQPSPRIGPKIQSTLTTPVRVCVICGESRVQICKIIRMLVARSPLFKLRFGLSY